MEGADLVNYSDGFFTNNTDFTAIKPALTPPLTSAGIVFLYAVKHNPFAYFRSVQEGDEPGSSLANVVGFDGPNGLIRQPSIQRTSAHPRSRRTSATISMGGATRVRSATSIRVTTALRRV